MAAYAYLAPESLSDALLALSQHQATGERIQPLAGGTDLLVQLRGADQTPRTLMNIKKIPELTRLHWDAQEVFIGAAVPGVQLAAAPWLNLLYPGLVEAMDLIGSSQIQGRASMGGNLCNASPAGDCIPALIANQAQCQIASLQAGAPELHGLPVADFVRGVGRNALAPTELLVGLRLPVPGRGTADAYLRFTPRSEMDIAVASAGVSLTLDAAGRCVQAGVAIGAVAPTAIAVPTAVAALVGTALEPAAVKAAAEACRAAANPISDKRGSADFRRHVVGVLCERAIGIARQRAQDRLQETA